MIVIGIDPGLTGAVAVIPVYRFAQTQVYPFSRYTLSDLSTLLHDMRHGIDEYDRDTEVSIYLEEPSLNPYLPGKPGEPKRMRNAQSFWKLGRSLGQLEGVCTAHGYPPTLIHPLKWQNRLNCRTKGDKKITKQLATTLFPFLRKTMGNGEIKSTVTLDQADALLIALYGYLDYANPKYVPMHLRKYINAPKAVPLKRKAKT